MMHSRRSLPLLLAAGALAVPSLAQQQLAIPGHAPLADGHHSVDLPFGRPGFRTQIVIDAAAVAPTGAVLQTLKLRGDRPSLPLNQATVPNVTVTMSHTSVPAGSLDTTFANNVTGATTVVFQGSVQLPAHTASVAGPLAWDITIPLSQSQFVFDPAQGNLLIDIVGNNPAGQSPTYWLDATQAGGAATKFGRGGGMSNFDFQNLLAATGNSLDPGLLTIGRTIDYTVTTSFSNPPGAIALGTSAPASPVDLTPLGAPGNTLLVDPIVLAPHSWTQSFIGWYTTTQVQVPNLPVLVGTRVYAQSFVFDAAANALGIVTSDALETRIGDPFEVLPMQQLDADDPAAVSGALLDFGFGGPEYGAVPVLLEGVFF